MASAEIVEVDVVVMEDRVRLELTRNEAQFILDAFHRVGGSPTDSRRRHAEAITSAIQKTGMQPGDAPDIYGTLAVKVSA